MRGGTRFLFWQVFFQEKIWAPALGTGSPPGSALRLVAGPPYAWRPGRPAMCSCTPSVAPGARNYPLHINVISTCPPMQFHIFRKGDAFRKSKHGVELGRRRTYSSLVWVWIH